MMARWELRRGKTRVTVNANDIEAARQRAAKVFRLSEPTSIALLDPDPEATRARAVEAWQGLRT